MALGAMARGSGQSTSPRSELQLDGINIWVAMEV